MTGQNRQLTALFCVFEAIILMHAPRLLSPSMKNFEACSASRTQHENNLLTSDNQGNFSRSLCVSSSFLAIYHALQFLNLVSSLPCFDDHALMTIL
jgi:hypothetical protein